MSTGKSGRGGLTREFDEEGFIPGYEHFPDALSARAFIQAEEDRQVFEEREAVAERLAEESAPVEITGAEIAAAHQEEVDALAAEHALESNELVNKAYGDVLYQTKGLQSGGNRPHTGGGSDRAARQADAMMAAMADPAYAQAYNNEVSFNIGGQNIQFRQGEMHEDATDLISRREQELEQLRASGASEEEIRKAERDLRDLRRIQELTDPSHGPLTEEEKREIQRILDNNPDLAEEIVHTREQYHQKYDVREIASEHIGEIRSLRNDLAEERIDEDEYNSRLEEIELQISEEVMDEIERQLNNESGNGERDIRVAEAPSPLQSNVLAGGDPDLNTDVSNPLLATGSAIESENPLLTVSAAGEIDPYAIGNVEKINPVYNANAVGDPELIVAEAKPDLEPDTDPEVPISPTDSLTI